MSEKRAEEFEVRVTTEDAIEIVQRRYDGSGEEDIVAIHPAQVAVLVEWLYEARSEIENESA